MKKNIVSTGVALLLVFQPLAAYAGLLSLVGGVFGAPAQAQTLLNGDPQENSQTLALLEPASNPDPTIQADQTDAPSLEGNALVPNVGPLGSETNISSASKSDQISVYVVRQGDTLGAIAKMFGVSVNTIAWANNVSGGAVHVGDTLVILPVSGIQYTVKRGDTLKSVAAKFKSDATDIADFNGIPVSGSLADGEDIIIPDGEIDAPAPASSPSSRTRFRFVPPDDTGGPSYPGYYLRPIADAPLTQGLHGHNAVDLGASIGTPIVAAAQGVVIVARIGGYNGGYGNYVVISHPNGTQTLYAHASRILVQAGETVSQGQIIAAVGNTGRSTGPHLHFEVRGARNPFQ